MVLGRVFVAGVVVATVEVGRLDVAKLGELAAVFEEARNLRAKGVVLDFPPTAEVEPSAAVALLELLSAASVPLSPGAVEEMVAKQSGCYRIPVMREGLELAISGLSTAQCFALGAEPHLADLVLAESWMDGVRILASRMPTMIPTRKAA